MTTEGEELVWFGTVELERQGVGGVKECRRNWIWKIFALPSYIAGLQPPQPVYWGRIQKDFHGGSRTLYISAQWLDRKDPLLAGHCALM